MLTTLLLTVTAYCSTGHTCANGHYPSQQKHTIAARREWPLGTRVRIEGLPGTYVVEDRLAKRYDDRIDIFLDSKHDCLKWGKQQRKVTIVR